MCAQLLARPRKNANHLIVLPSSHFWAPLALLSCSLARVSKEHREYTAMFSPCQHTYLLHTSQISQKKIFVKKNLQKNLLGS